MKKIFFLVVLHFLLIVAGCKKDDDGSKSVKIVSTASNDGFIVNSNPDVLQDYHTGSQGKEIRIGWNGLGYVMRGFLSFDLTTILPANTNDEILVVEQAVLKVYESNTNLHPFDADGVRTVQVELVEYGTLTAADYNTNSISNCGLIADWGYNVLQEHHLDVTTRVKTYLNANPNPDVLQFMLHFTDDDNVDPDTSPLEANMWNIFSGDETQLDEYVPVLEVKYHYEKDE